MLHGATPAETYFSAPLHTRLSKKFQRVTADLGVSLTPASRKLRSHANSRQRDQFSHAWLKCELLQP